MASLDDYLFLYVFVCGGFKRMSLPATALGDIIHAHGCKLATKAMPMEGDGSSGCDEDSGLRQHDMNELFVPGDSCLFRAFMPSA